MKGLIYILMDYAYKPFQVIQFLDPFGSLEEVQMRNPGSTRFMSYFQLKIFGSLRI